MVGIDAGSDFGLVNFSLVSLYLLFIHCLELAARDSAKNVPFSVDLLQVLNHVPVIASGKRAPRLLTIHLEVQMLDLRSDYDREIYGYISGSIY